MSKKESYFEEVALKDYLSFHDNPRQRNTVMRAKDAKKKHLAKWREHFRLIQVAELPNGQRYLIDAHTRRYLIKSSHFQQKDLPNKFFAYIIPAKNYKEVEELYESCDSTSAVEKKRDAMYSTMKSLGYIFQSDRFQAPSLFGCVAVLNCSNVKSGDYESWMSLWYEELIVLDKFRLPKGNKAGKGGPVVITATAIAGALQLINKGYADEVHAFLLDLQTDNGTKKGTSRCGVQCLIEWMATADIAKGGGAIAYPVILDKFMVAFNMYINKGRAPSISNKQYTKAMRKKYECIKTAV